MASLATSVIEKNQQQRTRNACDACRARKVKCLYDEFQQLACRGCQELKVDCTHDRPRKRRGPPSKYVEEQIRKRQQGEILIANPPEPPNRQISSSSEVSESLRLEQLAPLFVIEQVINDWFDLVHPVAPILHRNSFLRLLRDSGEAQNDEFVCLVISICAATVATLRRKASMYATSITVDKCYGLISSATISRSLGVVSLRQCQIKYNMANSLGTEYGMDSSDSQLLFGEALSMTGYMLHYRMQDLSLRDQELLKRLFWLCFVAQCTFSLHGRPSVMPFNPSADLSSLRPQNLNDYQLYPDDVAEDYWHGQDYSYIPGLNALINLFMLWYKSQIGDPHDMVDLTKSYELVLASLDNIPPELRWRGGLSRPPRSNFGTDVQMVNLYITQIHIRSFLLEQMHNATQKSQDSEMLPSIISSRQNLVNDMLAIVYQMPEQTLEANGHSLISKLRDIGLALLNDHDDPGLSIANLDRLLAKLNRLDVRRGGVVDSTSPISTLTSPGSLFEFGR